MIFSVAQSALAFRGKIVVEIPIVRGLDRTSRRQKIERRRAVECCDGQSASAVSSARFYIHPPIAGASCSMQIPIVHQNFHREIYFASAARDSIFNKCCVRSTLHPNTLLQSRAAKLIFPNGHATFQPK